MKPLGGIRVLDLSRMVAGVYHELGVSCDEHKQFVSAGVI